MFFLSPIDSCVVSFFVHVNNLCFYVRMDWQLLVAPDDILDHDEAAMDRWESAAVGMFRDLVKHHQVSSFPGPNMWHVFVKLWMCLWLGSLFCKKSWTRHMYL